MNIELKKYCEKSVLKNTAIDEQRWKYNEALRRKSGSNPVLREMVFILNRAETVINLIPIFKRKNVEKIHLRTPISLE
jgi:hypothetical protein